MINKVLREFRHLAMVMICFCVRFIRQKESVTFQYYMSNEPWRSWTSGTSLLKYAKRSRLYTYSKDNTRSVCPSIVMIWHPLTFELYYVRLMQESFDVDQQFLKWF